MASSRCDLFSQSKEGSFAQNALHVSSHLPHGRTLFSIDQVVPLIDRAFEAQWQRTVHHDAWNRNDRRRTHRACQRASLCVLPQRLQRAERGTVIHDRNMTDNVTGEFRPRSVQWSACRSIAIEPSDVAVTRSIDDTRVRRLSDRSNDRSQSLHGDPQECTPSSMGPR